MNPSYMAYNKAFFATIMNTLMGIEPPEPKGKQLNQTDGKLFASKNGNGDEINNNLQDKMEKEAEVRAHLDKLAAECKQRYLDGLNKLPYVKVIEGPIEDQFNKYLDDITTEMLSFDEPENCPDAHARYVETQISFAHKKAEDYGAAAAQKAHADHIVKQIILNRNIDLHTGREYLPDEEAEGQALTARFNSQMGAKTEPKYPRSDLIEALEEEMERVARAIQLDDDQQAEKNAKAEEAQAEVEAHVPLSDHIANPHWLSGQQRDVDLANAKASKACVHSGERVNLNYDNYTDEAL